MNLFKLLKLINFLHLIIYIKNVNKTTKTLWFAIQTLYYKINKTLLQTFENIVFL